MHRSCLFILYNLCNSELCPCSTEQWYSSCTGCRMLIYLVEILLPVEWAHNIIIMCGQSTFFSIVQVHPNIAVTNTYVRKPKSYSNYIHINYIGYSCSIVKQACKMWCEISHDNTIEQPRYKQLCRCRVFKIGSTACT